LGSAIRTERASGRYRLIGAASGPRSDDQRDHPAFERRQQVPESAALNTTIRITGVMSTPPIHRIALPGTRALTILVAFDAGARNERPEENGMAHFLEHLVFKGGEKYPTYRTSTRRPSGWAAC
jgi:hypothetical protein